MEIVPSQAGVVRISRWIFNCYLVQNGGRPFVVDPGLPSIARAVAATASPDGSGPDGAIAFIAVTHGHVDHMAGVPELMARTGAPLHLPARMRPYLGGQRPRSPGLAAVRRIWPVLREPRFEPSALAESLLTVRRAGYDTFGSFRLRERPSGFLADGDSLPDAEDWVALAAPGHTDDSMVFHHGGSRTMLSGDAILTHAGRAWFNPEMCDPPAAAATRERLMTLRVDHLFPGHGLPVHGRDVLSRALNPTERPSHPASG